MNQQYMPRKIYTCIIALICFATSLKAQTNSTIHGQIKDINGPVEFVNILLYANQDSIKIKAVAVSDSLGHFTLKNVVAGNYILKTQMVGYNVTRLPIAVGLNNQINLGEIILSEDSRLLGSVEVVSQKKVIQKTTQGFIISAKDNITQAGGTATDLLKSIPTVVVDAEGAITIRGKGPMILINGRVSGLANTDQIPASSIESVEIINNPTAQYDADSEGGIINITLKKSTKQGTNAGFSVGGGMGAKGRTAAAFNINHQSGKWNVGLSYDMRYSDRVRNANGIRTTFDSPLAYLLTQKRNDQRSEQTQNLKLNIDYALNANNKINVELLGNIEGQNNTETLQSLINSRTGLFQSNNSRVSFEDEKGNVGELAVAFAHKMAKPGEKIVLNASSSLRKVNQLTDIVTTPLSSQDVVNGKLFLQNTHSFQTQGISNFKVDYTKPLSEVSTLETGYKAIIRSNNIDFQNQSQVNGIFQINPSLSNVFDFHEQVHAAYIQVRSELSKAIKFDVGLRAEQVMNNGSSVNNKSISFDRNYANLFPTANISYALNESDFVKFSYGKRINRPGLRSLNPLIDITDSLNQHGGNPYLKPEIVHAFEIGYNKEIERWSFSTSAFYRASTNIIRQFTEMQANGVALTTPQNFGNGTTYGIEEIITWYPAPFWSMNTSVSIFQQNIDGAIGASDVANNVGSWYGKWINNFTLSKRAKLQIISNYTSPVALPQGTRNAVYNIDLGFQTKILKGKGGLGIVLVDIFNMQNSGQKIGNSSFSFERTFKIDTRAVFVTFAYSFTNLFKEDLLDNKFSND